MGYSDTVCIIFRNPSVSILRLLCLCAIFGL